MELNEAEILLVDDERILRLALADRLFAKGASVRLASDGREALALYREKRPDLLILDVMMPRMNGLAVAKKIRQTDKSTPILFLTALESEKNEVQALALGADGYLGKSVSDELLFARVTALLRPRTAVRTATIFSLGSLSVRPEEMMLVDAAGHRSVLSDRELALLRLFASTPNKVFSRDYLTSHLWPGDTPVADHVLTMTIVRLREKMGKEGTHLQTRRGTGYIYCAD